MLSHLAKMIMTPQTWLLLNVFTIIVASMYSKYNGCYLGPYHVTESRYRAVTQTELKKDDAELRDLIGKIHTISPGLHPKTSYKNMMLEMASMCAPGYWFTLKPLQKDMLSLWKSNGNIVYFVRPSYCFSKCKI